MLDWLIIGAGIHGAHLAHVLLQRGGVQRSRLRLLDPHETLLERWRHVTANVGMAFLRSPSVHHIGIEADDLHRFAQSSAGQWLAEYRDPYHRPSLTLFDAHADSIVRTQRLDDLLLRGRACGLQRQRWGWRVLTDRGELDAKRVVLAIGRTALHRPAWAPDEFGGRVAHIFDPEFARDQAPPTAKVVVVGGGISAAQTATALARCGERSVTLLMRQPIRKSHFDSNPCWNGPKCLTKFHHTRCYRERRRQLQEGRYRGTMPHDVARELLQAVENGRVDMKIAEVVTCTMATDNCVHLQLATGETLSADRVVLATGFDQTRPGSPWLDAAIANEGLPCAPCGYPIPDKTLAWAPGLYVSGALAELELGATAPNIRGARMAAERLLRVADSL
ncbi:MAG TPA: FAD-dependent oxidoreductase [Chloroflexi bacterium]|nr:FAD-dependent oxidoreductase [Chloroflexota bacterium]